MPALAMPISNVKTDTSKSNDDRDVDLLPLILVSSTIIPSTAPASTTEEGTCSPASTAASLQPILLYLCFAG